MFRTYYNNFSFTIYILNFRIIIIIPMYFNCRSYKLFRWRTLCFVITFSTSMTCNMRIWFLFKFPMFRAYNYNRSLTINIINLAIIILISVYFFSFLYKSINRIYLIFSSIIWFSFWTAMTISMVSCSLPKLTMNRADYTKFLISFCVDSFGVIIFISMYCLCSFNKNFCIYSHNLLF